MYSLSTTQIIKEKSFEEMEISSSVVIDHYIAFSEVGNIFTIIYKYIKFFKRKKPNSLFKKQYIITTMRSVKINSY